MNETNNFKEQLKGSVEEISIKGTDTGFTEVPTIMTPKEKKEWEKKLRAEIKRALEGDKKKKKTAKVISEKEDDDELIVESNEEENEKAAEDELDDNTGSDTEKAYLDREALIHELKIKMYKMQIEKHTLTPDKELFYEIMRLERENAVLRKGHGNEFSDKTKEREAAMLASDMKYEKTIRDAFMVKATRVDKLAIELKRCNDKIDDLKEFQTDRVSRPDKAFSPEEYKKSIDNYETQRLDILIAIYMENPKLMQEELEEKEKLQDERSNVLGPNADSLKLENMGADLTEDIIKNKQYATARNAKGENIIAGVNLELIQAENNELIEAKARVEELEKERKKLPKNPTTIEDVERVALITRQLSEAKQTVSTLEKQSNLEGSSDGNKQITDETMSKNAADDKRDEVDEVLDDVDNAIKDAKKVADGARIADPIKNTKETVDGAVKGAIVGGIVAGKEGVATGAMTGAFIAGTNNKFKQGLQEKVNDPGNVNGAIAIIDGDRAIDGKAVSRELKEAEKIVAEQE